MNAFIKIVVIGSFSVLSGCMTEATQQRFTQEGTNTASCRDKVIEARVAIAKFKADEVKNTPTVMFKDENKAMMYLMVKQMGQMNVAMIQAFTDKGDGLETCDDLIVAMVRADSQKVAGLNSNGKTAISWVAGLIGLGILSDKWGPSSYNDGNPGEVWNVSGSRVVNRSTATGGSTVSSSGEGLGLANVFNTGSGQSVGGLQPRTTPVNGSVTDLSTGSNSGTNEPTAPGTGDDTATTLPVEE